MSHFSTFRLNRERLMEALPLVRMALPGIGDDRWVAHCEALARSGGGVLAATAADGAMHGLAVYRFDDDLVRGSVIRVDVMLAYELSPAGPVRRSLLAALELVRQGREALGIVLAVAEPQGRPTAWHKGRSLEGVGFQQEAMLFWKPSAETQGERFDARLGHA